jgi:quinol monooxygenase YgiN
MADHVVAVTLIHGLAGRRDELRELMRATEDRTASEPGCRTYRFAATLEHPDEYVHVQEWDTEQAFRDHQRSASFRAYQQGLFGLLARPSEMRIHRAPNTFVPEPSGPGDPRGAG